MRLHCYFTVNSLDNAARSSCQRKFRPREKALKLKTFPQGDVDVGYDTESESDTHNCDFLQQQQSFIFRLVSCMYFDSDKCRKFECNF